jgi:protein-tyrosine phosphatase
LWIDIHSHILPGLDDGARDMEESVRMARLAVRDGTRLLVCTPHWVPGLYNVDRSRVLAEVANLNDRLRREGILLKVCAGQEIRLDVSIPSRLAERGLLTINDTGRYVLIELPTGPVTPYLDRFLFALQGRGVRPVLSHAERVDFLREDIQRLYRWIVSGVLIQITAGSLLGQFGPRVRDYCTWLLKHRMVHLVASDAHDLERRPPGLSKARDLVEALGGSDMAVELFERIPNAVIRGQDVEPAPPLWESGAGRFKGLRRLIGAGQP